jgi:N utilization substance protein B
MTEPGRGAPRRLAAARLAAVQALYQCEITGVSADQVIGDFLERGVGGTALLNPDGDDTPEIEVALAKIDKGLFAQIVRGALERRPQLDAMIEGALSEGWSIERLEVVMRSILRAGAFELSTRGDLPPKVAISEYVNVAGAFYAGVEPGMVNAVLDRIARVVRAGEIGSRAGA